MFVIIVTCSSYPQSLCVC